MTRLAAALGVLLALPLPALATDAWRARRRDGISDLGCDCGDRPCEGKAGKDLR